MWVHQLRMSQIKAVLFDFMGTCLDWHTTIRDALPAELSEEIRSKFALEWRQAYFDYNAERLKNNVQRWRIDAIDLHSRRTKMSRLRFNTESECTCLSACAGVQPLKWKFKRDAVGRRDLRLPSSTQRQAAHEPRYMLHLRHDTHTMFDTPVNLSR